MFDGIAHKYDFLNRFLSLGIDVSWRKKAIDSLRDINPAIILDVATGTADMAIMAKKRLNTKKLYGIDISEGMLALGRGKVLKEGFEGEVELLKGDSETLGFTDNTFDAVTVAFGVRNFENLENGLTEIKRVLRPGGKLVVLEFSKPTSKLIKPFYGFYMNRLAPWIGKLFSRDKGAYQYLNDSVQKFPEGEQFLSILNTLEFKNTSRKPLSLGICSIYCGVK